MGEKVVRSKHLKTTNQGVDGRFSRSFFFVLFLFLFYGTVFTHSLLTYQKSNEWAQRTSKISDTKTTIA